MKNVCLITCIIFAAACQSPQGNVSSKSDSAVVVDSAKHVHVGDTAQHKTSFDTAVQRKNEIHVSLPAKGDSVLLQGHMDSAGASVVCYVSVSRSAKLTALIEPAKSAANIRFNQIILPNGQSDGPFGQTLTYKLAQTGLYKIIIGPSLMAENPYSGKFVLHLTAR